MKKILYILFISVFLIFGKCFANELAPVDTSLHKLITYSFIYGTKDTSLIIWMGNKYDTLKLASNNRLKYLIDSLAFKSKMKVDSINAKTGYATLWKLSHKLDSILGLAKLRNDSTVLKGFFTNFKALQKRDLNNHDSLSTLDEKAYASLTGKPDLTVYRQLNNHDSLSTLDEKAYASLTGKPDLSVYRQLNNHDSLSVLDEKSYNSLTDKPTISSLSGVPTTRTITTTAPLTIDATTSADLSANRTLAISAATTTTPGSLSAADKIRINNMRLIYDHDSLSTLQEKSYLSLTDRPTNSELLNNIWYTSYDYAGNVINVFKVSKDNILTFGPRVGINAFLHVLNSGVNEIVNIPLSTASTTGTEHGVEVTVGANKIMKVSAKVSATGTADSTRVTLSSGTMLGFGKNAKASIDLEAGTATRAPIQMASGDTLGISKAGAIGFNGSIYYGYNGSRKHFAFLQNPVFKDTVTAVTFKALGSKGAGKILVEDAKGILVPTIYTQGLLKTNAAGLIAPIAHGDAGKYLQSNGATSDPTWVTIVTSSGDFLDAVLGMQVNATLDPAIAEGNRYIILDSGALHANFGTINKNMAGGALTLGNGDIVQYVTSEFRIAYDASAASTNVTVLVTLDKNGASSHDWTYGVDTDTWVDRGSGTLHNSLSDLNTGAGTFYHMTQAQYTSQPLIKSDTTSLVATKTNIAVYKLKNDTTANTGFQTVFKSLQKRALNNHDSLSTLDEKSYNSLTDKPTLYSGTVTSVATGLGLSGGTITSTGTLLVDTASTSILSRQRALKEYQPKGNYTIINDSSKYYKLKADSIANTGFQTVFKSLQKRALNNHDSLSTLDERKYQSLTDTLTWGLGLSQTGHVTKVDTSSASILSRQRAANTYQVKGSYLVAADIAGKVNLADSVGGAAGKYATGKAFQTHIGLTTTAHGLGASAFHADNFFATAAQANATHTGDATGATALTLATVNDSVGYYNYVYANAKGLVTGTQFKNYQLDNDSTVNSGYFTNYKASIGSGFSLINNQWLTAKDYAGNSINVFKVSKDNLLEFAPNVGINAFFHVLNSGFNNIVNIPLDASAAGSYQGVGFRIGATDVLKIRTYGLTDSARIIVPRIQMTDSVGLAKIAMGRSDGLMRWTTAKYLNSLAANRLLIPTATNVLGQLAEGATGTMLRGVTGGLPIWSTPTYPNTATNNKLLVGNGTNWVESTPTFPNASATSGKVIKSDGTNWTASTETYAAPGTARKVMISDGTNWINSTETYAIPSNAGNLMTSDGTNWTSSAAPTWNQSTTGSAAKWTTKRKLFGRYIDGSVNMDSTITDTYISSAATWNAKEDALTFGLGLNRAVNTVIVDTADVSILSRQRAVKTYLGRYTTAVNSFLLENHSAAYFQTAITTGTPTQYFKGDLSLGTFPTALSSFTNDLGNYGSFVTGTPWTSVGYWYSSSHPTTISGYGITDIPTTLPASDVYAWAKAATKPSYTYSEVGAQVAGSYVIGTPWTTYGYLTSETDPTIYTWAKQSAKPSYTYSEVGAEQSGLMSGHLSTYTHANIANGQTAYGWGNHASAGYATTSALSGYLPLTGGTLSGAVYAPDFVLVSSDRRLKTNIIPIKNTSWVNNINWYTYNLKNDTTKKIRYGTIAQELEVYAPELVSYNSEGMRTVNYIGLLIVKITEMQKQIDELKKHRSFFNIFRKQK